MLQRLWIRFWFHPQNHQQIIKLQPIYRIEMKYATDFFFSLSFCILLFYWKENTDFKMHVQRFVIGVFISLLVWNILLLLSLPLTLLFALFVTIFVIVSTPVDLTAKGTHLVYEFSFRHHNNYDALTHSVCVCVLYTLFRAHFYFTAHSTKSNIPFSWSLNGSTVRFT